MSLITGQSVTKTYGTRDVLKNASFRLDAGSRVGLVGPNGSGKTTLLRILAGLDTPTEGTLQRARDLRLGYLPQDPPALVGTTLRDAMLSVFADLQRMEDEIHELSQHLGDADERMIERYGRLQHEFETRGGYGFRNRVETVLSGLGFPRELWDRELGKLSGGQRTRGYLARLLLEEPDMLLLDEPTNHLDLDAVEWLERWVQSFRGAFVVVSHDRYFLDHTCEQTWEVTFGALEAYRGGYTEYVKKREDRFRERMKTWESQQEFIASTEDFIRRFLAGQRSKEAQGRRTRLERFLKTEAIPKPRKPDELHLRLLPVQRTGDLVLRAGDLTVGYSADRPLLGIEELEVRRGQRIAIVGPNGAGKTTLLRTLLHRLPALGGKVTYGTHVVPGYLSQTQETLAQVETALDAVRTCIPGGVRTDEARDILGRFLFRGDDVFKRIDMLSGGERSRVVLAQLSVQHANLLALDEPTNHLDIPATETMQEALSEFPETILFVTHDRYLVQEVATNIWAIDGSTVRVLPGKWEEYLRWRSERASEPPPAAAEGRGAAGGAAASRPAPPATADYEQRKREKNRLQRLHRRHGELEEEIHALEQRLETINKAISSAGAGGDVGRIAALGTEYEQVSTTLHQRMEEWEQVGEELEQV